MYEAMLDYQRSCGLKPIGPHRRLANQVFAGAFTSCQACDGRGILDGGAPDTHALCPSCDGHGQLAAVPDDEIEQRRALVLEKYPDTACDRVRLLSPPAEDEAPGAGGGRFGDRAAIGSVFVAPRPQFVGRDRPGIGALVQAVLSTLVIAPAWLFTSILAFRGGKVLVGTVLLVASAFAALSGLGTASPSSFGRQWTWVWGALGVGLFALLGVVTGQAACAGFPSP